MDYTKLKTRLKDKLTKEYKKTKHTDPYLEVEKTYKRTRDSVRMMEVELQALSHAFSSSSIYENITSSLASGFEIVKDSIKRQNRVKTEISKEEPDVFGIFAGSAVSVANSTKGDISRQFEGLSYSLKKVSAARVQLKEGISRVLDLIEDLKETAGQIDDSRLKVLDIRQNVESSKTPAEEERLKQDFTDATGRLYDEMKNYADSQELSEITVGITSALRGFFGDAYDGMAENTTDK